MDIVKLLKKIMVTFLIICVVIGISNKIFATELTLNQVVDKFNSSNPMAEHMMNTYNATEVASMDNNKITLTMNNSPFADDKILKVVFNSQDNILSTSISKAQDTATHHYMGELSMVWSLLDCIAQLNGYEKAEIYTVLRDNKDNKYTLSTNGFEINELSDMTNIKIDLNKKLSITNLETETNEKNVTNVENNDSNNTIVPESKIQNTNNNAAQEQNNRILNADNKQDNTKKNDILPQTGVKNNIFVIILITMIVVVESIIIMKHNKEIK